MKVWKDTIVFCTETEFEANAEAIQKLVDKKETYVRIKKVNENRIEFEWDKNLQTIILVDRIEHSFKSKYSAENPNARFIKSASQRNIETRKYFYRQNKKCGVLDIGFLSIFLKDLREAVESNETKKPSVVNIKKVLWIIDKECLLEYEKQHEEDEIETWLDANANRFKFKAFPHQRLFVKESLKYSKRIIISNTSSGKSFSLIMSWSFYRDKFPNIKTLLIVPNIQLLDQFEKEFKEQVPGVNILKVGGNNMPVFGMGKREYIDVNKTKYDIIITTFQSMDPNREDIADNVKLFLEQLGNKTPGLLLLDEVHISKASTIQKILKCSKNCKYRIGTSGTLKNYKDNMYDEYTLYGFMRFGAKYVTEINALENSDILTPVEFHRITLNMYNDLPAYKQLSYAEEQTYFCESQLRAEKLKTHILKNIYSPKKNILLFFSRTVIGENLYELFKKEISSTFLITGATSADKRQSIKTTLENSVGNVLIASFGTTAAGIDFKNVHSGIYLNLCRSDIRIFQTLGRLQRIFHGKDKADLYFVVDKFEHYESYSEKHMKAIAKSLELNFGKDRIKQELNNNKVTIS